MILSFNLVLSRNATVFVVASHRAICLGRRAAKASGEIRCLVVDEVHNVLGDRHTEAA